MLVVAKKKMDEENKNPNGLSGGGAVVRLHDKVELGSEPIDLDLKTKLKHGKMKNATSSFNINSLIMSKNGSISANLVDNDHEDADESDSNYHFRKNYFQQLNTNHAAETSTPKSQTSTLVDNLTRKINRRKMNRHLRAANNRNTKANSDEDEDENEIFDEDDEMEEGERQIHESPMNPDNIGRDTNDSTKQNLQSPPLNSSYCKICKKEFCNKYFLKTHMANKHNVHSNDSLFNLTEPLSSPPQSAASSIEQLSNGDHTTVPVVTNNLDGLVEDYCELCNKQFCNKYYLKVNLPTLLIRPQRLN